MEYITDDFLRAAAIMTCCKMEPVKIFASEELIGENGTPKIKVVFHVDRDVVNKLNARQLSVEPISFGLALKRLKNKVYEIKQQVIEEREKDEQ